MHVGGVFNADPHAGNILVSTAPNQEGDAAVPVFLDFGLTKRLPPHLRVWELAMRCESKDQRG